MRQGAGFWAAIFVAVLVIGSAGDACAGLGLGALGHRVDAGGGHRLYGRRLRGAGDQVLGRRVGGRAGRQLCTHGLRGAEG